jgi:hypothetical protein
MISRYGFVLAVCLILLLTGCRHERRAGDTSNFTLALQCGNGTPIQFKVVGDIHLDVRDLAASNCSVHGSNRVITAKCPRAELTVSPLVEEAERYLQMAANQSEP